MTLPQRHPAVVREAEVLAQCLALLKLRRVFHFRNQSGALYAGEQRRYVRFGAVGSSDILGCLPAHSRKPGVLLCVETKRPGGKLTAAQSRFLANVEENGGIGLVCCDVVQLDELLTDLGV